MAITAKFQADFSSFSDAVTKAERQLADFSKGAGTVEKSLAKMTDSFSGRKVVQEAALMARAIEDAGGVATLTAKQLEQAGNKAAEAAEKMQKLGIGVPQNLQNIIDAARPASGIFQQLGSQVAATAAGFITGQAVINGVSAAFHALVGTAQGAIEFASHLDDLSKATNINIESLQALGFAGKRVGLDLDDISNTVGQLAKRIATGDASAVGAIQSLGLNFQTLRSQKPEDLFITVGNAINRIQDPIAQAGIGAELFGKKYQDALRLVKDGLAETMQAAKDQNAVISEENVKALDAFGDAVGDLTIKVKVLAADALAPMVMWLQKIVSGAQLVKSQDFINSDQQHQLEQFGLVLGATKEAGLGLGRTLTIVGDGAKQIASGNGAVLTSIDLLTNRIKAQQAEWAGLSATDREQISLRLNLQQSEKDIATAMGLSVETIKRYAEARRQASEQEKIFSEAVNNLLPILTSPAWDGSIDSAIKLGAGVHDLAVFFGESEGTVKSHQEALKTWSSIIGIEATKSVQDLTTELQKLGTGIPQKFFDDAAKADAELIKIEQGAKLSTDALGGIGAAARPAMSDLNALFHTVGLDFDLLEKNSTAGLKHTADVARQTYEFMAQHADMFSRETIQHFKDIATAADAAAGDIGAKFKVAFSDALGDLNRIVQSAFEGGGGFEGAATSFATKLTSNLLGAIPVVGPIIGQFGGAIVSGIKRLFGGPSQDELSARATFAKFQQQFGSLEDTAKAVAQAYVAMGRTGADAARDLQSALDATHKSAQDVENALKPINKILQDQQKDANDLQAAIERYGFSIEELGPAMQKQKLDDQAQQILNDWRLLVGSGIQLATVNEHMAGAINDYLKLARQTGQEVPAAMKPILQRLIDAGELTDDAGNAITDLKDVGVSFSETMTEGFQKVVDKLQELLDRIGGVGSAINKIPEDVIVHVGFDVDQPPDITAFLPGDQFSNFVPTGATGGMVSSTGIQQFATGGIVRPFTPRGQDSVLALLSPGEMVLTPAQQRALGTRTHDQAILRILQQLLRATQSLPSANARATRDATLIAAA